MPIKLYTKHASKLLEFVRFCIVGCIALLVQYALYCLGLRFIGDHNLSYFLSYLFSAIVNFTLTLRYTFKVSFSYRKVVGFVLSHAFNLVFQVFLLNLFIRLGAEDWLAPWPVYLIAVPTNFVLVRLAMKSIK